LQQVSADCQCYNRPTWNPDMQDAAANLPSEKPANERLESWKDIAAYLQREVRTVQLWEKNEALPVHRHAHLKRGTVYAYKAEIDAWVRSRSGLALPQNPPPKRRVPWFVIASVAAVPVTVAGVMWIEAGRQSPARQSEANLLPLTSDPGSEMGASFSPDGTQVAFAWKRQGKADYDIYVTVVGSRETRQLTNTTDWDVSPAWSPDGRQIAFHRRGPGPDGECGVYSVSPLGGPPSLVTVLSGYAARNPGCARCGCWAYNPKLSSAQFSWSPDGEWLAHTGISLINIVSGQQRTLTRPPDPELQIDAYPAFSPDGKSLAFVRARPSIHELYFVKTGGGEPRRIVTDGRLIFGLCWTVDGREIVYSSGTFELGEATLWRVPVDGGAPKRVEAVRERAWLPSISTDGRRLAFTRRNSDTNIWQVPAIGRDPSPAKFIASTLTDGGPVYSPDGARIAFTSARSGTFQLWVCARDGSKERQLTFLPSPGASNPAWSPDSKKIAFNSGVGGTNHIYVVDANGGTPERVTDDDLNEAVPTWSGDGKWLYFSSTRTGQYQIWKVPAAGGLAVQLTKKGGNQPVESPDGKYVYHDKGPGVMPPIREFDAWRTPVDGGEEVRVFENGRSRWTVVPTGLYFYEPEHPASGDWSLKFFDFARKKIRTVAKLPALPLIGQRPAVSPDGRTLLYTQLDLNDSDIMLVDNFK
jgi:Tol biopolymer transport system component